MTTVSRPLITRNRALALSTSLMMFTFLGLGSVAAYAEEGNGANMDVTITVPECLINVGTLSMEIDDPVVTDTSFVFTEEFDVFWGASGMGEGCGASLEATRSIFKDSDDMTYEFAGENGIQWDVFIDGEVGDPDGITGPTGRQGISFPIGEGMVWSEIGSIQRVDGTFDLVVQIPLVTPPGSYSTRITFAVGMGTG